MEFTTMLGMLGEGFLVTLQLFFVTLIGALPLGVLVALGRMSRFRPISYLFRLYISIMRGTPLMLQLCSSSLRRITSSACSFRWIGSSVLARSLSS